MTTDLSRIKNASDFRMQYETPVGPEEQFRDYKEFKSSLDFEIKANAEGFVRIGYLLKVARDTNILEESGYKTVAEFAQAEYGLTKDVVSRFIAINDRYSVDGYSEKLLEKYEGYGVAKLQEMLTLPDEVIEEIKPSLTKREIVDIKKEIAEEEKITPVEIAIEAAAPAAVKDEKDYTPTERIWKEFFHENRELYKALGKDPAFMAVYTEIWNGELEKKAAEALLDILAPNGDAVLWSRVPGVGKFMISVHADDQEIVYTNTRTNEKIKASISNAENDIHEVFGACDAHEWELVYGEPLEKQESPKIEVESPENEVESPKKGTHKTETENGAANRQQDDSRKAAATKKYQDEIKAYKEKTGWDPNAEWTPEKGEEYAEKEKAVPVQQEEPGMNPPVEEKAEKEPEQEEKPGLKPELKTVKTKPLSSAHDAEVGNRLVNTETGEVVDVIGYLDNDIKVATDHGLSIICEHDFKTWSIIDDDAAESQPEKIEAERQQDNEEPETGEEIRGLRQKIFDKEREFEEVFEDAYADGLTPDGLTSCVKLMHELRLMFDKMFSYKLIHHEEKVDADSD